jgi:hypothetical protein
LSLTSLELHCTVMLAWHFLSIHDNILMLSCYHDTVIML